MTSSRSALPRRSAGSLSSVLASEALAALVTYFVLYPDSALHFRALQRATGLSSRSLQHELARLEKMKLIQCEPDGRLVRYRPVADHPRWAVLREMVRQFAEPADVLRVVLGSVPGVDAAFIFGSCARGDMHAGSDIDVFALGEALKDKGTRLRLAEGTLEASMLLNREVNVSRYSREKYSVRRSEGFLRSVLKGPKMWLVGDETVLDTGGA